MQKLLPNILLLFILNTHGNASQSIFRSPDTVDHETRLKEFWNQFRRDNKVLLHKFESRDSIITFGSNKDKSFLTSVMILNRRNQENSWFFYNSNGIFKISVVDSKKTKVINKRKKAYCSYYFENDKVFYKKEDGKNRHPEILLFEAKKYQDLANQYLKG